jgi:hypothetical protein
MDNKYYVRHIRIIDYQCSYIDKIRKPIKLFLYANGINIMNTVNKNKLNIQFITTPNNYTLVKNEDVTDDMDIYKFVEYYNEVYPIKVSLNELIELTKKNNKLHNEIEKMDNTLYGENYDETEPDAYKGDVMRPNNKYEYYTEHRREGAYQSTIKHNIVIGLYTYDVNTNKYKFVKYSMYNKLNNMYYVCE